MQKPPRILVSLWLIAAISHSDDPILAVEAEQSTVRVEELASAKFQRVKGAKAGASVLDVGGSASWRSIAVCMPTVDFDDQLYCMPHAMRIGLMMASLR